MRKVKFLVFGDNGNLYLSDGVDVMVCDSLKSGAEDARMALDNGLPLAYFGREAIDNASFASPPTTGEESTRFQWVPLEALESPDTVHGTWKIINDFLVQFSGHKMENFYRPMVLPRIARADFPACVEKCQII